MQHRRSRSALFLVILLLSAVGLEAQWVMVARAAAGRVQRMTQKSSTGGYDVATVVLAARATGVYDTAIRSLRSHAEVTITDQDSKKNVIQFRKGEMVAGLQISALGDKLSQLVIASSAGDGSTPIVLDGVLRICKDMKVECTVQAD